MKVFIGSSKEVSGTNGLLEKIAVIVEQCGITPIRWNQTPSVFKAGNYTLENLEVLTATVDAAIFICSADDKTWYRGKKVGKPRDNVIFEHGLFSGKLDRKKSIIVRYGNVKLPNDLDGVTFIDFSEGQQTQGEANLKQTLQDLKGTTTAIRIPYDILEKTKSEIEKELDFIKRKGLERIFNSQCEAVADFRLNCKKSNTLPIKILCIRGESFVSNREENWGSEILTKREKTIVLGNFNNDELIMNRYKANKNDEETENEFLERYKEEMKAVQGKIKKRSECSLFLHNESNLRYRMIFVDDYLYLSKFANTKTASKSEVIKIPKDYALYSVCEDHYNQILSNAKEQ
jgi:predicted nucleotide-binding protein